MNCVHCGEPILVGEALPVEHAPFLQDLHSECAIRIVIGSAAHQLGECSCFGGKREDPPGVTKREAAKLAYETFKIRRAA